MSALRTLSPVFRSDLRHTLKPQKAANDSYSFSRDSTAVVKDFEGRISQCKVNEARFSGVRRVENLAPSSDFSSGWIDSTSNLTITKGVADPWGGNTAIRVSVAADAFGFSNLYDLISVPTTSVLLGSVYIKPVSGAASAVLASIGIMEGNTSTSSTPITLDDKEEGVWKRYAADPSSAANGTLRYCGISFSLAAGATEGIVVDLAGIQMENITGQTVQEPSEFVSVGVGTGPEINQDPTLQDLTKYGGYTDVGVWTESVGALQFSATTNSGYISVADDRLVVGTASASGLYYVKFTIANLTGGASGQFSSYAESEAISFSANGEYTGIIRADDTGASPGDQQFYFFGSAAGTASFDITSFEIWSADHGANVDGVKYFPYHNLITATDNIVDESLAGQGQEFGRSVQNLLTYSDPVDGVVDAVANEGHFILIGSSPSWDAATRSLTVSVDNDGIRTDGTMCRDVQVGEQLRIIYDVELISGHTNWEISAWGTAAVSGITALPTLLVGNRVLVTSGLGTVTTSGSFTANIRTNGNGAGVLKIYGAMIEPVTGQSNQNPGGFVAVSNDPNDYPYHGHSFGSGYKEFPYLNGNTVDGNNIVIPGVGSEVTPGDGYHCELSRTNVLYYSNTLDNSSHWSLQNSTVVQQTTGFNKVIGQRLWKLADSDSVTNGEHRTGSAGASAYVSTADNEKCSFSLYAAPDEYDRFRLMILGRDDTYYQAVIELDGTANGSIISQGLAFTSLRVTLVDRAELVYFVEATVDLQAGVAASTHILYINLIDNANQVTYTGTAGYGMLFGHIQHEKGASCSSYIPTSGGTASRGNDWLSYHIDNFPDKPNSVFFTMTDLVDSGDANRRIISVGKTIDADYWQVRLNTTPGQILFGPRIASAWKSHIGTAPLGEGNSASVGARLNGFTGLYVDGSAVGTPLSHLPITDFGASADTYIDIGHQSQSPNSLIIGKLKDISIYGKPLSDAKMEALTA